MDKSELNWSEQIWKDINSEALKEVGKVRVAQKVFPTSLLENDPTQIANEEINFNEMTIKEGSTKRFVEIYREFSLTGNQIKQESEQKTCRTLARMAAKEIALGEDAYIFQLSDDDVSKREKTSANCNIPVLKSPNFNIDNWDTNIDKGLLAVPRLPELIIDVHKLATAATAGKSAVLPSNAVYGEKTFEAVTKGISNLVANAQAPPYALFLPTAVYADTYVPPSSHSLVTTADRIKPLVEGGFYSSGVLPEGEGLLVALGGEPIKLFVGREIMIQYVRKEGARYYFRAVERIQYVVRDPRALVLLKFA